MVPEDLLGCGYYPLQDVGLWVPCFGSGSNASLLQSQQQQVPATRTGDGFCSVTCIFQIKNKPNQFISTTCKSQPKSVWTHKNQNFQIISVTRKRGGSRILNSNHLGQSGLTGNMHLHSRMARMGQRSSVLSKSWLAREGQGKICG